MGYTHVLTDFKDNNNQPFNGRMIALLTEPTVLKPENTSLPRNRTEYEVFNGVAYVIGTNGVRTTEYATLPRTDNSDPVSVPVALFLKDAAGRLEYYGAFVIPVEPASPAYVTLGSLTSLDPASPAGSPVVVSLAGLQGVLGLLGNLVSINAGTKTITVAGLQDRGAYSAATTYNAGDLVDSGGKKWRCKLDGTLNVTPAAGANWAEFFSVLPGNQNANTVYAGPTSGGAAAPSFRAVVPADLGNQNANKVLAGPTSGGAAAPTFRAIAIPDLPTVFLPAASFGPDPTRYSGLTWAYFGGYVVKADGTPVVVADGTLALTASATNKVGVNPNTGAVSASTGASYPTNTWPIAEVVTGAATITSVTDRRGFMREPPAAGSSSNSAILSRVYKASGTQSVTNSATFTKVDFDTVEYDSGGTAFSTTNDEWTVPAAGDYLVACGIQMICNTAVTNSWNIGVYKNGTELNRLTQYATTNQNWASNGHICVPLPNLALNDKIDLRVGSQNNATVQIGQTLVWATFARIK